MKLPTTKTSKVRTIKGFIVDLESFKRVGAIIIHDREYHPVTINYTPCKIVYTL